jgi:hypothetical protein
MKNLTMGRSAIGRTGALTRYTFIIFFLLSTPSILFSQSTRTSVQSGNWSNQNTWDCGCVPATTDHVVIKNGHTVTFVSNGNVVRNLTIESGGILSDNGNTNTITGNLVINGNYSGSGTVSLTGVNATIDGTGSISNTATFNISGNKTILSSANLTKNSGSFSINGGTVVTNNGTITIGGTITAPSGGSGAGATWTNAANSTLNIGGSGNPILSGGTRILNASAVGNTVNYYGSSAQNIKAPTSNTYYNLKISGVGGSTLTGATIVSGDLTISNSTLAASTFSLNIRGNWTNTGTFSAGTGTVTVDGSGAQAFTSSFSETFYNLTTSKSGGEVSFSSTVTVTNTLNMASTVSGAGNINMGTNTLTLGSDVTNPGTLTYSGTSRIIGKFERYINAVTSYRFPIGVSAHSREVLLTLNSLTSSGSVVAEFVSTYPGNTGLPMSESGLTIRNTFRDGYWSLTAANSFGSSNYNLDLTGNGFVGFPSITTNTRLLSRANSASGWIFDGTHGTNSGNTVRRNNLTLISAQYAFGDDTPCDAPVTSTISGSSSVCRLDPGLIYSVTETVGNSYTWSVSGGTVSSGQGTASIVVDWGATALAGSVSVVESNACTTGEEKVLSVAVNPIPPTSISGKFNVPQNSSTPINYTTPQGDFTSFEWTVVGGTFPISQQGSNSIDVTWGAAGTGSICVKGTNNCGQSADFCLSVNIYRIIYSVKSGNWKNDNTWDCSCDPTDGDNITILTTHSVSVNSDITSIKLSNLSINAGGTLNTSKPIEIMGDLDVSGTLAGSGILTASTLTVNGNTLTTYIQGTGNITNNSTMNVTGNKIIPAGSSVTKTANLSISSGVTIDNYGVLTVLGGLALGTNATFNNHGTVSVNGNLSGGTTSANTRIFNNLSSATLNVGLSLLLSGTTTTGVLNATATGNTVSYTGSTGGLTAQNIKTPNGAQYVNLSFKGTASKTLPSGTFYISGDFYNESTVVPGSGTIEFNGSTTITGTASPSFNNLVVATGSTLTSYNGVLNIAGNFTDNGTFNRNGGTIAFNGSSSSTISGSSTLTSFENITASSSGGVVNNKSSELYGILDVSAAVTFDADGAGSGSFVLRSLSESTSDDASVGQLTNGATVSGNVRVERYMSNIQRIYRYLSSPVQSATVGSWNDNFYITGNIPGLKRIGLCGFLINPTTPSLFYYNETVPGAYSTGYIGYPESSALGLNSPLQPGRGYAAYIRNCTEIVINVDGVINHGDVVFDFVSYNNFGDQSDGYNLIGNPYPSAVDWASVTGWDRVNISNVAAITNNSSGAANFEYLDASDVVSSQVIASGQAFWVQATADGPSLTIHESAKTTSGGSFYRHTDSRRDQLVVSLSDGKIADKAFVKLRSFSSKGRDDYDGLKLKNSTFDVYTLSSDGLEMAINSTPAVDCTAPIKLGMRNVKPGSYTLSLETLGKFDLYNYYLQDNFTHKTTKLEKFKYEFTVTSEVGSASNERFSLFLEQKSDSAPVNLAYDPLVCRGSALLTLESSSQGIEYNVYDKSSNLLVTLVGDGKDISYIIPDSLLHLGNNEFDVSSTLACGMVGATANAMIVVSKIPEGWNAKGGKSCGEGSVVLEVTNLQPDEKVRWFENKLDQQAISDGPVYITTQLSKTETFFAEIQNAEGCVSERVGVEALVVYTAEPQVVEMNGTLFSNFNETSWYFNEILIGTGKELIAEQSGTYLAEVTANGCSARTSYNMIILSGEAILPTNRWAYPNPFKDHISVPARGGDRPQYVSIQDVAGRELKFLPQEEKGSSSHAMFDLSRLQPGVYALKIVFGQSVTIQKMIKN